jgi:hypothetical protein
VEGEGGVDVEAKEEEEGSARGVEEKVMKTINELKLTGCHGSEAELNKLNNEETVHG